MQHMYDVEWYGKSVRLYITKIEKLDWAAKTWDTKYVLMAKKEWEDVVDNGSGMPGHMFHKDIAISDEYMSFEDLVKDLTLARIAAEKTFRLNYGEGIKPENLDWAFLDIFKFSRVDQLDVEMAKEKVLDDMPHTTVMICASHKQESDLDAYEAEYNVVKGKIDRQRSYMDPNYDPPPSYRERS